MILLHAVAYVEVRILLSYASIISSYLRIVYPKANENISARVERARGSAKNTDYRLSLYASLFWYVNHISIYLSLFLTCG